MAKGHLKLKSAYLKKSSSISVFAVFAISLLLASGNIFGREKSLKLALVAMGHIAHTYEKFAENHGVEISVTLFLISIISVTCIFVKDRIIYSIMLRKHSYLSKIAVNYNKKFRDIQAVMIKEYSNFDQKSVAAISEAGMIIGSLMQRLINANIFMTIGKNRRVCIYDAWTQLTKPLTCAENSNTVLLFQKSTTEIAISDIEKRLETLLDLPEVARYRHLLKA